MIPEGSSWRAASRRSRCSVAEMTEFCWCDYWASRAGSRIFLELRLCAVSYIIESIGTYSRRVPSTSIEDNTSRASRRSRETFDGYSNSELRGAYEFSNILYTDRRIRIYLRILVYGTPLYDGYSEKSNNILPLPYVVWSR